jgi:hypothetical protein
MLRRLTLMLFFSGALSQMLSGQVAVQARDAARPQSRNHVEQRKGVWKWERNKNGSALELIIRGEVEFNDDSTAVSSLGPDGSLELKEKRGGVSRQLAIKPSSGGLNVSYFVDGLSQPYDAEAKAWLAGILTEAVTENGLNARPRAQQILRERGVGGLLDELSRLKSDHVKELYVQELYKHGGLDARTAPRLVELVAREMSSDHYKTQVLSGLPESLLRDEAVRKAYQEAIGSVRSAYYQAETLSANLKSSQPVKEIVQLVCDGAGTISSDFYKAQVLGRVTANSLTDDVVRSAFLAAVVTIGSDFYRSEALAGLAGKGARSNEVLFAAARATAGMSSDHYKAEMLLKLLGASSGDEAARASLVEAARTIKSDQERGRVLSAIFK